MLRDAQHVDRCTTRRLLQHVACHTYQREDLNLFDSYPPPAPSPQPLSHTHPVTPPLSLTTTHHTPTHHNQPPLLHPHPPHPSKACSLLCPNALWYESG